MITRGAERLAEVLRGRTQQWLAGLLGVMQSTVSLWVRGESRPEAHQREALLLLFGIPVIDWLNDEEREFLKKIEEHAERLGLRPAGMVSRPTSITAKKRAPTSRVPTVKATTPNKRRKAA